MSASDAGRQRPLNGTLTDVPGVKVGHFTDPRRPTGCTVVRVEQGAVAGVDVRGAAPGTRETELLSPTCSVERIHALLLSGGSAFGLDAASGVMRWLDENGHGLSIGATRVPIVPAAILFDLLVGDARIRPDAAAGYAACAAAGEAPVAQGSVGAGAGAVVGKLFGPARAMKGGIGSASLRVHGVTVAALVAVNAIGDVRDPLDGRLLAGALNADRSCFADTAAALRAGLLPAQVHSAGGATTIGVVATDATLTKAQAQRVAMSAHDGLARTISPVHTPWDGDTLFALSTCRSTLDPAFVGMLAAEVMARAVVNAVRTATRVHGPGVPELPVCGEFEAAAGPGPGAGY